MNKFNWSEEELLAYEQMKKRIIDEVAALSQKFDEGVRVGEERGIQIGHEKGKIEGKVEGIAEGEQQAKIAVAKNLLKAGISIDVVSQTTGLPRDEIKQLQAEKIT